jgi:hypothetical protein
MTDHVYTATHGGLVVQGIQEAQNDPISLASPVTSMTPDSLMAYCRANLESLDTQMEGIANEQQTTNGEQKALGDLDQMLQNCSANGITSDKATCIQIEQTISNIYNQIKLTDPNSPILTDLAKLHDNVMATGSGPYTDPTTGQTVGYIGDGQTGYASGDKKEDSSIDSGEIAQFVQDVKDMNTSLNNNSQMGMIQLQSLMSQQQQAVELCTNMVNALDQASMKVVSNIGQG